MHIQFLHMTQGKKWVSLWPNQIDPSRIRTFFCSREFYIQPFEPISVCFVCYLSISQTKPIWICCNFVISNYFGCGVRTSFFLHNNLFNLLVRRKDLIMNAGSENWVLHISQNQLLPFRSNILVEQLLLQESWAKRNIWSKV